MRRKNSGSDAPKKEWIAASAAKSGGRSSILREFVGALLGLYWGGALSHG